MRRGLRPDRRVLRATNSIRWDRAIEIPALSHFTCFGNVEAPEEFRHRRTSRLSRRRHSVRRCSRSGFMANLWRQSLASSRVRTFISAERLMAKDRCVSRQARRAGLLGLSVGLSVWGRAGAPAAHRRSLLIPQVCSLHWRLAESALAGIDNDEVHHAKWGWCIPIAVRPSGLLVGVAWHPHLAWHCAKSLQVQLHGRPPARLPNAVKIAPLCFGQSVA